MPNDVLVVVLPSEISMQIFKKATIPVVFPNCIAFSVAMLVWTNWFSYGLLKFWLVKDTRGKMNSNFWYTFWVLSYSSFWLPHFQTPHHSSNNTKFKKKHETLLVRSLSIWNWFSFFFAFWLYLTSTKCFFPLSNATHSLFISNFSSDFVLFVPIISLEFQINCAKLISI